MTEAATSERDGTGKEPAQSQAATTSRVAPPATGCRLQRVSSTGRSTQPTQASEPGRSRGSCSHSLLKAGLKSQARIGDLTSIWQVQTDGCCHRDLPERISNLHSPTATHRSISRCLLSGLCKSERMATWVAVARSSPLDLDTKGGHLGRL